MNQEVLETNPIFRLKRKRLNNSREIVMTETQLWSLIDAASRSSNHYLKVALLATLSTGGRRAEIMGLRWDEVNLSNGEVKFNRTKNGKRRSVLLGAADSIFALHQQLQVRRRD